jgi:putative redox protein
MAERVIVRQDNHFRTLFLAADPEDIHSDVFEPVEDVHKLTPYGMLLSSLASCTALILHTFAQNHDIHLKEVEIHAEYQRVFREDCENCDEKQEFDEEIEEKIMLEGDLSAANRQKLLQIAYFCPIFKILKESIKVHTSLVERTENDKPNNDIVEIGSEDQED